MLAAFPGGRGRKVPMTVNRDDLPAYGRRVLELADDDPQLQELIPDPEVEAAIRQPRLSYDRLIATVLDGYAKRPALGERAYEVRLEQDSGRHRREYVPRFDTVTYYELHNRIKGLANTWRHHDQHRVNPGEFVAILGFTGTDFATVDLACAYVKAVSVPLQTTLAGADLDGIFSDTAPVAIAATMDDLVQAAQLAAAHESIRSVIAFDYDERIDDDREQYAAAQTELAQVRSRAQLVTLDELIAFGDFEPWEFLPPTEEGDQRMALLIHSSGSTGTPKGAIYTEHMIKVLWSPGKVPIPVVRVAFAPMNHVFGRTMVFNTLVRGGTVNYTARPDLSTLLEDLRVTQPTELAFFPRVLDMIHRHYLSEVVRRVGAGQGDHDTIKAQVMEEMRGTFLGDRIAVMLVSSAPTTAEIKRFMKECFQAPFVEGYGSTEAGSVTMRDRITRPPIIDYKLRDVPELGYYTTDKPYPRGELCVKTTDSTPGYFKRPEATAKLFDGDGFLVTGDIVEERGPDHVVYIDRRNDVLKLSQGEFVAVGALGTVYENGSEVIQQIYAYGNSAFSYLVAVVVPNMELVEARFGKNPDEAELKELIRSELKRVAQEENLKSFEVPRDFIVETEPFSHENGLLSSIQKKMRPNLERRYGERLEELYAELELKQNDELMALHDPNSTLSVIDKIGKALEAALGVNDVDVDQPYSFVDLGGDSLGATAFSALLHDIFGVTLPVNSILSPAGNPQQWARAIEAERQHGDGQRPTFAKIHGEGARQINAKDVDITAFLDEDTLRQVPLAPPVDEPRSVLLTGATGFLGRFLCLEWLERAAQMEGKVICLVRAVDHDRARRRLASVFEGVDPALEQRYHELAGKHLEVVVGDAAELRLGLSPADFDRLADEVDAILHCGALVNHVMPYEDLFGPNVAGTAELVRLALTKRQKRFDFISSVATTFLIERNAGNDEDTPLRARIALSHDYAAGYGASKWAAEQLLHSAHRRFGLPVSVFRGDMMLAHSRYHGQLNVPDMFTRLVYSIVMTGLAPASFYRLEPDGSRASAHYDGLPVDFIAAAVVGIGLDPHQEMKTFHVLNHHADDRIGLDTFVDWIEAAGYPVEREPDHHLWVQRFEAKLKALPEEQRQYSALNLLDAFGHPYKANEPMVGSQHFQDGVRRLPIGPEVPHLTEEFIHKYLDDLRRLGLIPAPGTPGDRRTGAMAGATAS
jgi:fatty acid CoA ligase FadD9